MVYIGFADSDFAGHTSYNRPGDGAQDESVAGQSTEYAAGGAAVE